jgi:hypothetical protein
MTYTTTKPDDTLRVTIDVEDRLAGWGNPASVCGIYADTSNVQTPQTSPSDRVDA